MNIRKILLGLCTIFLLSASALADPINEKLAQDIASANQISLSFNANYNGALSIGEDGTLRTATSTINLRDPRHKGATVTVDADGSILVEKPEVDYRFRGKELRVDPSRGAKEFDVTGYEIDQLTVTRGTDKLDVMQDGKAVASYSRETGPHVKDADKRVALCDCRSTR